MKANELMIGNWLHDTEEIVGFSSDFQVNAKDIMEIAHNPKHGYVPIPLTEEWLLKFGVAIVVVGGCHYLSLVVEKSTPNIPELYIYTHFVGGVLTQSGICSGENEEDESERSYLYNKIQYVHQLQNLYFALTGQELELKHNL